MSLQYRFYDASAAGYPPPQVPLLAGASWSTWASAAWNQQRFAYVGSGMARRWFKRGRYALREAFKLCGAAPGTTVLVPSLHCRTMLDPALSLGATVVTYPLDAQLQPHWDSVRETIQQAGQPVAAFLLTHYFGFAQDGATAAALCRDAGVTLVEDCSHAAIVASRDPGIGQWGDFCTTSPYKFVPCEEGGILFTRGGLLRSQHVGCWPGLFHEARIAARVARSTRIATLPTMPDANAAKGVARAYTAPDQHLSRDYVTAEETLRPGFLAQGLAMASRLDAVAVKRRSHFEAWLAMARRLPHAEPLFGNLDATTVPYMFPLLLKRGESDFARLKQRGVPIWRWDEILVSTCTTAMDYSRRLIQLPCHQGISPSQLNWLHEQVFQICSQ